MRFSFIFVALVGLIACCFAATHDWAKPIVNLPGLPSQNIPFKQYSGYVTVNVKSGRRLFFWFAEAQSNPATAPVTLWMNGGPYVCVAFARSFSNVFPALQRLLESFGPFHGEWSISRSARWSAFGC